MSPGSVREASSTNFMPGSSCTLPSANLPTRIFGPCRSAMMATSRPARCAASRTSVARSMWSCAVPWLKFSRTTLTPARIICSSSSGSLDAGPRVATILVARRCHGRSPCNRVSDSAHGWCRCGYASRAGAQPGARSARISKRRQRLAFQHFQEGAAAGGDVAHVLLDAVLGDGRQRVAAAGDAEGAGESAMARAMVSVPSANASNSNTPTGPFQTMVPAGLQLRRQPRRGLRADVEDQVVVGHVGGRLHGGRRVGGEGLGRHHVGRESAPRRRAPSSPRSRPCASPTRSASASDLPIGRPAASRKVLAMPPPTISWSTLPGQRLAGW